jgi:hypothetical protein
MNPSFRSPRQAAGFASTLAATLLLPFALAWLGWPGRGEIDPTLGWNGERFSWLQEQLFAETNEVDIAFVGSSRMFAAIDTPRVQSLLSEKLHREANVLTLTWFGGGHDVVYEFSHELLRRRVVRLLVICDDDEVSAEHFHSLSFRFWPRLEEDPAVAEHLTLDQKIDVYGAKILAEPRYLLGLFRPNRPVVPGSFRQLALDPKRLLLRELRGTRISRMNFGRDHHFTPFEPSLPVSPADVLVYSETTRQAFTPAGPRPPSVKLHFARELAKDCRERGAELVVLHLPYASEVGQTTIPEREPWLEGGRALAALVGIPNATLFAGLSPADRLRFFFDEFHLNRNGQVFFTRLIAPALLRLYETKANRL